LGNVQLATLGGELRDQRPALARGGQDARKVGFGGGALRVDLAKEVRLRRHVIYVTPA
jgi:hypothetical protein